MSEYRLDGHDLDDPAGRWRLTSATALPTWGAPRSTSITIPGRMGVLPTAPATTDPITIVLGLLVTGTSRAGLDVSLRALAALVRGVGRMMTLTHAPAGAPARQALVRLSGSVEPAYYPAGHAATVKIVLEAPEGLWRDTTPTDAPAADLSTLDGGVMPITDALILVATPTSAVTITDAASGKTMTWTGTPASGKALLLDPAAYTARLTGGSWSTTGATDASAGLSLSAGGFAIHPDADGHHALTTKGTSTGAVTVRARRAY